MVRVSKLQEKKKQVWLTEGSLIEVCTREKGLTAVWFEAVVLDTNPPPPSHARSASKTSCRVYVEYSTLLSDDGESPLRELVNLEYVRPRPPLQIVEGFELYDPVDAFYKDGWWTGVVTQLLDSSRYVVTFGKPQDELEFGLSDLRLHHLWMNGEWLPPQRKNTTGLVFSVGKEVEVTFEGDDYKDAWYPLKLIKDCGNGCFMVNCLRPSTEIEERIRAAVVCSSHDRPCPPLLKDSSKSFDLHDKVESFYDSGWWFGVVKEVLPDSRYVVVFQNENKTERLLHHSELRPHMVWKDGKWHTSQGEILSPHCTLEDGDCLDITQIAVTHGSQDATTNETSGSRSLNSSDGDMIEQTIPWRPSNASVSLIKRKRCLELSKEGFSSEENVESVPMEKVVSEGPVAMEKVFSEGPVAMEKVVSEGHNNGSEDDQPLTSWVGKVHTPTPPLDGSTLSPQPPPQGGLCQSWPFVKKDSFLWDRIESREAFQKIPQNPHFQPLQHSEDFCRETLAICYMGTFADLVDKACNLKLDEPRNSIEKMLDTLVELESHGFNVEPISRRLKEILSYRDNQENLQDLSAGTHSKMENQKTLKADMMKQKSELEKCLSQVASKMESNENNIASLQSTMDEISKELEHLSRDYEALICKPFEPPVQNVESAEGG
ncbi:hypothetical protein DM860_002212 [Cuscuta australis]|uniref:Agenet domain-containing protein n=1 Tax=Cuscuta australis TaxID=267555 RepID=A0A328E0F9_9ASTE|nr:hypothetical protein DM860_002212 [Cuscuta australis]